MTPPPDAFREPLDWRARLRAGLPLPPIAGATNVASILTDSGAQHISGSYSWTISATDFSGIDLQGGGLGSQYVPARLTFGLDRGMGRGFRLPKPSADLLGIGGRLRGGRGGAQDLAGTLVLQTFAPASWLEGFEQGEAQVPAALAQYVRFDAEFQDSFNRPDSFDLGSPWHESETAAPAIQVSGNRLNVGGLNGAGIAYWDADVVQDHFSELDEGFKGENFQSGPAVRVAFGATVTDFTGYLLLTEALGSGLGFSREFRIYRLMNFDLVTGTLPAPLASYTEPDETRLGLRFRLQAVGGRISVIDNQLGELFAVTDPTPLTGTRLGLASVSVTFIFPDGYLEFRGGQVSGGSGILTAERWGTPTISKPQTISPAGITSAEAWGNPRLNLNVRPSGVPSAEVLGIPKLNLNLLVQAIASLEAWGLPAVSGGGPPAPPGANPGGRAQFAMGDRGAHESGGGRRFAVGGRGRDIFPRRGT